MPHFIVEMYLDGYETEEEARDACVVFMKQELDMTASSVEITPIPEGFELNPSTPNLLDMIKLFEEAYRRWVLRERHFYNETKPCTAEAAEGFEDFAAELREKFYVAAAGWKGPKHE